MWNCIFPLKASGSENTLFRLRLFHEKEKKIMKNQKNNNNYQNNSQNHSQNSHNSQNKNCGNKNCGMKKNGYDTQDCK